MRRSIANSKAQRGYILLSVLLVMTLMLVALTIELPRISQQIKREKEEELIHRGREYAIAIKRFYHKNGTYPVSLEQLESTNNVRYLRKRYKDPMTESGEFRLVHIGEAQINVPPTAAGINQANGTTGTPGNTPTGPGTTGSTGSMGTSGGLSGGSSGFGSSGLGSGGLGSGGPSGLGSGGLGSGSTGLGSGNQGTTLGGTPNPVGTPTAPGANQPAGIGQMGTLTTQNLGNGMVGQGGAGPIIGVASTSKKTSIKEFNNNNEYDEWMFVYDPRVEQAGAGGVVIAGPTGNAAVPGSSGIPQPVQPVRTPNSPQ